MCALFLFAFVGLSDPSVCAAQSKADVQIGAVDARAYAQPPHKPLSGHAAAAMPVETVTVTAARLKLMGIASTASEGVVEDKELQLTPAYRPGQLLETVPGLIVTLHSGEGKASQFLLRGYNLDHGTDLATFVDGMPVNQPTQAHGQGYTDLNFMIPELTDKISFTKGPYYASVGDFGAVGSVRIAYRDEIVDQVTATVGAFGFERMFAAGSQPVGSGTLLEAGELQHYDGPFDQPDDARKLNAALRYSDGDDARGFSLTGMLYRQIWTNTTDISLRAIEDGAVPSRFGTLDPSDGGQALRASLSGEYHDSFGEGLLSVNAFAIHSELHLFNDFTHFLVDPVHGDQEDQFENRNVLGGAASYTFPLSVAGLDNEVVVGTQLRYDALGLGRLPSEDRNPLASGFDPAAFSDDDRVAFFAGAAYGELTTHWTEAFRSVIGLREDYQHGSDVDLLAPLHESAGYTDGGTKSQALFQPKASLIYAPIENFEIYASAGEGFHSADLRGVNQDVSVGLGLPHTSLLAKQYGEELGLRSLTAQNLTFTLAFYDLWQQSETTINPDVGEDIAGPPSERYGLELNATWQIRSWLELYGSVSENHTRFTQPFDDGTGHSGKYITDAPATTGSLALYLDHLGPWSGGLNYRYLGDYPLSSGPCSNAAAVHDFPGVATSCANAPTALGQINGKGFGQLNLDARYATQDAWILSLGLYNLLDAKAPAAEFWYVDRLKSEIAIYPGGRADVHEHPLEPLMFRASVSRQFP